MTTTTTDRTVLTVRRATPEDAGTVQTLLLELADHEGDAAHVQVGVDDWREQLADPAVVVLVARLGDRPAGYVSATRRRYLWGGGWMIGLDDLYVRAEARNRGIGERLMGAMAAHASGEGLLVRWELEVENTGAWRFYERLGASVRTKGIAGWGPAAYADHARRAAETLDA